MNGNALHFALTTCGTLLAAHLSVAAYIAKKDLSGDWKQYNLKRTTNSWSTYSQHFPSLLFDVIVLLFPALYCFALVREDALYLTVDWGMDFASFGSVSQLLWVLWFGLGKAILANGVNRLWAMLAHRLFHVHPTLYKMVHKKHHCALKDLCATSGWQDTSLEFLFMEILGVFIFAALVFPALCAPWPFHVLLALYNGAASAIDHSGFYVPGTVIDGRYHLVHHRDLYYNYAEMETLDWLFGTLRHYEPESRRVPVEEGKQIEQKEKEDHRDSVDFVQAAKPEEVEVSLHPECDQQRELGRDESASEMNNASNNDEACKHRSTTPLSPSSAVVTSLNSSGEMDHKSSEHGT